MDDKKRSNEKSSATLRLAAGSYLLYLVYGLIRDLKLGIAKNNIIIVLIITIFAISGIVMVYTSSRYFLNNRKQSKKDD